MTTNRVERVAIYPSIGIARVGDSPDAFFFGPEVPGQQPGDGENYRDAQGRIKRQAARFRLYGLDAAGQVVREVTLADGPITWSVQVANEKAAWFNFDQAMDIPASRGDLPGVPALASLRRNRSVQGAAREQLRIRPRPRSIGGSRQSGQAFDDGCFYGRPVYLGELRTDEAGRLIFLGGHGKSASHDDVPPSGFANNDGWHDDTCDGPVQASVVLDGRALQADGAWVVVAPPDFAPGVQALVTGWDLLREVGCALDTTLRPPRPRFSTDIFPLLSRFSDAQWVNAGFALEFGWGAANDFRGAELLRRLNDPSPAAQPLRSAVFNRFRHADYGWQQADAWPGVYGDAATVDAGSTDPRNWMAILPTQYALLAQWAGGDFIADGLPPPPKPWDERTPAEQAQGLDRAVLDETTGGPFHPGCEFTWPMRQPTLYSAPFRLRRRQGEEPDAGPVLTSAGAMAPGGPLDGCAPGSLTRWMACPWQTDTASCLSAYRPWSGEYLPTFWPARVPNDVLTEAQYQTLMDPALPLDERMRAFDPVHRPKWLRGIVYQPDSDPPALITDPNPRAVFITEWPHIGMVTRRPGPSDQPALPARLWVETGRTLPGTAQGAATTPLWTHDPARER
ncbi:LodA/GoxA family CTQ-dependent oxidase [Pseudorhodoferax sp. Leaf267]|uniref:LodA/GoxA family CTQ-dependent oxidase n=1 Tax=Pseudorhodoferax sp. Leaf267 TaxID=1736316 RepID=UPI0006F558FD|nr:LodA/GoxA family CTQ-dependent oxidase [Pseudorhodoferax sp. Leaf267]KQP21962.1 hypothetical protein ASF43_24220 [Pseudorhodoferax sp. Leaf267]